MIFKINASKKWEKCKFTTTRINEKRFIFTTTNNKRKKTKRLLSQNKKKKNLKNEQTI